MKKLKKQYLNRMSQINKKSAIESEEKWQDETDEGGGKREKSRT